ncbi:MAG: hypothetical protein MJ180_00410 [Candidatus Gastranaerophilales bacterium]|nr:hypothetical protein [Candidatus Gastranaerophilales bacterium]
MCKKLALIFCLLTVFIIGCLVFLFAKTIDFQTIFYCLKLTIPAGTIAYFGGFETSLIATKTQKQFVDDLLLSPDQVLNTMPLLKYNEESKQNEESTEK